VLGARDEPGRRSRQRVFPAMRLERIAQAHPAMLAAEHFSLQPVGAFAILPAQRGLRRYRVRCFPPAMLFFPPGCEGFGCVAFPSTDPIDLGYLDVTSGPQL
jgi:hypothetical protein